MSEVIQMHIQETIQTGGGGGSDAIWLPNVSEEGVISWSKSTTTTAPTARNIKGADGADGADGQDGADGRGITSIVKTATSGNVDTYTITYTDSTTQTYTVTNGVNGVNGQDGEDGLGIKSVDINASNHLIITYDDDTTKDAGEIQGGGGTTVVANPTLVGTEDNLTGLQVGNTKYKVPSGGSGSATWGGITGTLANQTDLKAALDGKTDSEDFAAVELCFEEAPSQIIHLFDNDSGTIKGITYSIQNDICTFSGTATSGSFVIYTKKLAAGTYTMSCDQTTGTGYFNVGKTKTIGGANTNLWSYPSNTPVRTFTLDDEYYLRFAKYNGESIDISFRLWANSGETPLPYDDTSSLVLTEDALPESVKELIDEQPKFISVVEFNTKAEDMMNNNNINILY